MSSTTNEGRYGLYSQGSTGWSTLRYEEFQEEDIWGVFRGTEQQVNSSAGSTNVFNQSSSSRIASRRRLSTAARMIIQKSSSSSSNSSVIEPKIVKQHSAPVNIPDWSKIYGKKSSKNNTFWVHDEEDGRSDDDGVVINSGWDSEEEEDDDDDDVHGCSMMIPPHEWIAKKLARSQISSFSVYEGVGRTLKGRDLKNVRNAILTETGFLERG